MPQFDLVIMDECHRIGAEKTKKAVAGLFERFPDAGFVGATATPERSDAFDVISEFFKGICVYPHTLHDAIQAGIIQKPVYTYMTHDIEKDVREYMTEQGMGPGGAGANEVLKSAYIEEARLLNIPGAIRKATERHRRDALSYMKYIVFYADHRHLEEKRREARGWFSDAFPGMRIRGLSYRP